MKYQEMIPGLDYTVTKSSSNGMIQKGDVIQYDGAFYSIIRDEKLSIFWQDVEFNKKANDFEVKFEVEPGFAREVRKTAKHRFSLEEALELCNQMAYECGSQRFSWRHRKEYNPRKAVLFLQLAEWLEMLNSKKFRKVTDKRKEVL